MYAPKGDTHMHTHHSTINSYHGFNSSYIQLNQAPQVMQLVRLDYITAYLSIVCRRNGEAMERGRNRRGDDYNICCLCINNQTH